MSLIIVGAGGFGREVYQYVLDSNLEFKGFIDDNPESLSQHNLSDKLIGSLPSYQIEPEDRFIVAIGDPEIRRKISESFYHRAAQFATVRHPTAYIAPTAKVEQGCIIAPFAFVGPFALLESHVILNTYASVGHDTYVGACSTFSPYSVINGNVRLGREVFLGTHAIVAPGKAVGERAKLAAGAVALHNIAPYSLAVGNPAKARVMFASE